MSVTLNPIPHDDLSDNNQELGVGIGGVSPQIKQELQNLANQDAEVIHSNNADLYKNIDPNIDESGIIRDMTIKPEVAHNVDLKNQISSALQSDIDAQPSVLVSDFSMHSSGGTEYIAGQELMGGATFAPEHPAKAEPAQAPQTPQKPTIIMGQM